MSTFFEIQPESCRLPVEPKTLVADGVTFIEVYNRLYAYNPAPVYECVAHLLDAKMRVQKNFSKGVMFPNEQTGVCACGCGQPVQKYKSGHYRDYHSNACSEFTYKVWAIIMGYINWFERVVYLYHGPMCARCGEKEGTDLDHIIPVKHGGGACWISNFQYLCFDCHRIKTQEDFNWKYAERKQIKLQL